MQPAAHTYKKTVQLSTTFVDKGRGGRAWQRQRDGSLHAIVVMMNLLILPAFSIKRALANLHGTAARAVAQANAWEERVPNAGLFSGGYARGVFAGNIGGLAAPVFAILQKGLAFGHSLPACWAKGGWADRGRIGSRHAKALPRRAKGMRG